MFQLQAPAVDGAEREVDGGGQRARLLHRPRSEAGIHRRTEGLGVGVPVVDLLVPDTQRSGPPADPAAGISHCDAGLLGGDEDRAVAPGEEAQSGEQSRFGVVLQVVDVEGEALIALGTHQIDAEEEPVGLLDVNHQLVEATVTALGQREIRLAHERQPPDAVDGAPQLFLGIAVAGLQAGLGQKQLAAGVAKALDEDRFQLEGHAPRIMRARLGPRREGRRQREQRAHPQSDPDLRGATNRF